VDPKAFKIVVAKSPEGFRQDYEPFSAGILYCGAPGCAAPDLHRVRYERVTRPLFPLDDVLDPHGVKWAGEMINGAS
jgi:microcystin degradation protein MlrC